MTIHQLSIFIENRSGTLIKVLQILKESGIQIVASTIADTAEYGIYRLICSEPLRAYEELKNGGIAVALSNVFALELDDEPGRAADAVETFSNRECRRGRKGHPRQQAEIHPGARPLQVGVIIRKQTNNIKRGRSI